MLQSMAPGRRGGLTNAIPPSGHKNDLVRRPAGLPAGERVTEFVEQNDSEKREVFVEPPKSASCICPFAGSIHRRPR